MEIIWKVTLDKEMSGFLGWLLLIGKKILEFWYVEYGKEDLLIFLTSTFRSMFHEVFSDSVNHN